MATKLARRIARLQSQIKDLEFQHLILGISSQGVHILLQNLTTIAPLSEWTLNLPWSADPSGHYKYQHQIMIDGTLFMTISSHPVSVTVIVEKPTYEHA